MRLLTKFLSASATRACALLGIGARLDSSPIASPVSDSRQYALAGKYLQEMRLDDAEAIYQSLLTKYPRDFDLLHMMGVVQGQRGSFSNALQYLERALAINSTSALARSTHGNVLKCLGRNAEALASYERALGQQINDADIWSNHGAMLADMGRHEKALESYVRALAINPRHSSALNNQGAALRALGRLEEALACYDLSLAIQPNHVASLINQGAILKDLGRHTQALASFDKVLALAPELGIAHYNRGIALVDLKRYEEALACYDQTLARQPDFVDAHGNRGFTLRLLRRYEEALASFGNALAISPEHLTSLHNRGDLLLYMSRPEQAASDFSKLVTLAPDYHFAKGFLLQARMACCDWRDFPVLSSSITEGVRQGKKSAEPFNYLSVCESPELMKQCAEIFIAHLFPSASTAPPAFAPHTHARIRIGYVAGEFRHHATSILLIHLLENHDPDRFELFAFDTGWDDSSDLRKRLEKAVTQIVDISGFTDFDAATAIRSLGVDILVDLNGLVGLKRPGIFHSRAAPVQVNWLGFPGTTGAAYMDYILGDSVTIPQGHDVYYTEKVVRLPDTYQVNDPERKISENTPSREDVGLPASGFVFCSFNSSYKITPSVFDIWMRLLSRVNGSVLWLLGGNAAVCRNLRAEAQARGISPDRLIFAPRMALPDHLARHRLADLFLDTFPCNAHTTASDALWAGLPVLTCMGSTFASRVAGSLLHAIGLPELVTDSLQDYEALAIQIATTPVLLSELHARLANNRATHSLFNADRFRRHIESAYATMTDRWMRNEPPGTFSVSPIT